MKMSQYKELFTSESREILAKLNKLLVRLEKEPENIELLNEIFRHAHTLKGMSSSMGYDEVVKLSHSMESVLDLLRSHRLKVDKDIVSSLFEAFDLLEELIANTEARKRKKVDISGVVSKLGEISCKVVLAKKEEFKEKRMLRLE